MSCLNCARGKSTVAWQGTELLTTQDIVFQGRLIMRADSVDPPAFAAVNQCQTCKSYWIIEGTQKTTDRTDTIIYQLNGHVIRRDQGRRLAEHSIEHLIEYLKHEQLPPLLLADYLKDLTVRFSQQLKTIYESGTEDLPEILQDWLQSWYFTEFNEKLFPVVTPEISFSLPAKITDLQAVTSDKLLLALEYEGQESPQLALYSCSKQAIEWKTPPLFSPLTRLTVALRVQPPFIFALHQQIGASEPTALSVFNMVGTLLRTLPLVVESISAYPEHLHDVIRQRLYSIVDQRLFVPQDHGSLGVYSLDTFELVAPPLQAPAGHQAFTGRVEAVGDFYFAWTYKGVVKLTKELSINKLYNYRTLTVWISQTETFVQADGLIENQIKGVSLHIDPPAGMPVESQGVLLVPGEQVISFFNSRGKIIEQYPTQYKPSWGRFDPLALANGNFALLGRRSTQLLIFNHEGQVTCEFQSPGRPEKFFSFGQNGLLVITGEKHFAKESANAAGMRAWALTTEGKKLAQVRTEALQFITVSSQGYLLAADFQGRILRALLIK